MGKLKKRPVDEVKVVINPVSQHNAPPHITAFVNPFGTDHKGELTAMGNLNYCKTKEEVLLELGRVLLESSRNIQNWMKKQNLD